MRESASQNIVKSQKYNEERVNAKRKVSHIYSEGDLVTITNVDTTIGVSHKCIPTTKGPYKVVKALGNDRYIIQDVPGFQVTQKPFEGVFDVNRLSPWQVNQS